MISFLIYVRGTTRSTSPLTPSNPYQYLERFIIRLGSRFGKGKPRGAGA